MNLEPIARIMRGQGNHEPVPTHLGDDARRRDARVECVAADHRFAFARRCETVATVDENMLRRFGQRVHGACQRPQRGAQDVVAIDSRPRRKRDRKGRGRTDFLEQLLAALRAEGIDRRTLPRELQ